MAGFRTASLFRAEQVFPETLQKATSASTRRITITDVKCMIVRGTWNWNLIKIETDSGLHGRGLLGLACQGPGRQ